LVLDQNEAKISSVELLPVLKTITMQI